MSFFNGCFTQLCEISTDIFYRACAILTNDQLVALAVQGMLPMWKEKLLGQEFDNLGQLAQ